MIKTKDICEHCGRKEYVAVCDNCGVELTDTYKTEIRLDIYDPQSQRRERLTCCGASCAVAVIERTLTIERKEIESR